MSNEAYGLGDEEGGGSAGIPPQLRDPVGVLKRGWRWSVVISLVVGISASLAVQLIPDEYEATTSLLMSSKRIPDRYVPTSVSGEIDAQIEEIKSSVLTRRVLATVITESGLYKEDWEKIEMDALTSRLHSNLDIEYTKPGRDTSSVTIRIGLVGPDPEQVATAVNAVATRMINESVSSRSEHARLTTGFMRREFEKADEALRAHQRNLAKFREHNRGSLPEQQESTIAKLDRLEQQRRSLILQINELRSRLTIRNEEGQLITALHEDPGLTALRKQLAGAEAVYTEDHPRVISLRRQIRDYQAVDSLGAESRGSSGPQSGSPQILAEIEAAKERLAEIDAEVPRLEALIELTTNITEEYRGLEREEQILNENYNEYLRKLKDAELAQSLENAQQGGRLTSIETAATPTSPVVGRWTYYAGAIVLALGSGLLAAVLREFLFSVVIDEEHLEALTGAPVIGSISRTA